MAAMMSLREGAEAANERERELHSSNIALHDAGVELGAIRQD